MWHLSKQVDDILLADYMTVFDLRSGKCRIFILFLVYALVYPSIASNLLTLDVLSPWYDSVYTNK